MSLPLTISIFTVLLVLAAFSGWRGGKPSNPAKGPRMAPWRLIMVTAAAGALFMAVHIVNLLGVKTGR